MVTFCTLALVILSQSAPQPGIWTTIRGEIFTVIGSPAASGGRGGGTSATWRATFTLPELFCETTAFRQAPDGHFYARWAGITRFSFGTAPPALPGSVQPLGDAFLAFGPVVNGRITYLELRVLDRRKTDKLSGRLYFALPFSQISMAGRYRGGDLELTLSDDGSGELAGHGIALDKRFVAKGQRFGTRASLTLSDPTTGREACRGYVEWAPSATRLMEMVERKHTAPDQLAIVLNRSSVYPSGIRRTLASVKSN